MSMISSARVAHLKTELKKVPCLVPLVRFCKIVGSSRYRSEWLLLRDSPVNLFQPSGVTSFNRYPRIFAFVSKELSNIAVPKLLSFGCATGEEVFTLRRYFPKAEITGLDINPRSIAVCRNKLNRSGETGIRFELAGSAEAEPVCVYDAIFCLSVLRHGELGAGHPESCSHLIRFADFERTVAGFNRCLQPGGYLAIRGSNFRFSDTEVSSGFDVVFSVQNSMPRKDTPLYDTGDRYLAGATYNDVIFRKRLNP